MNAAGWCGGWFGVDLWLVWWWLVVGVVGVVVACGWCSGGGGGGGGGGSGGGGGGSGGGGRTESLSEGLTFLLEHLVCHWCKQLSSCVS